MTTENMELVTDDTRPIRVKTKKDWRLIAGNILITASGHILGVVILMALFVSIQDGISYNQFTLRFMAVGFTVSLLYIFSWTVIMRLSPFMTKPLPVIRHIIYGIITAFPVIAAVIFIHYATIVLNGALKLKVGKKFRRFMRRYFSGVFRSF